MLPGQMAECWQNQSVRKRVKAPEESGVALVWVPFSLGISQGPRLRRTSLPLLRRRLAGKDNLDDSLVNSTQRPRFSIPCRVPSRRNVWLHRGHRGCGPGEALLEVSPFQSVGAHSRDPDRWLTGPPGDKRFQLLDPPFSEVLWCRPFAWGPRPPDGGVSGRDPGHNCTLLAPRVGRWHGGSGFVRPWPCVLRGSALPGPPTAADAIGGRAGSTVGPTSRLAPAGRRGNHGGLPVDAWGRVTGRGGYLSRGMREAAGHWVCNP